MLSITLQKGYSANIYPPPCVGHQIINDWLLSLSYRSVTCRSLNVQVRLPKNLHYTMPKELEKINFPWLVHMELSKRIYIEEFIRAGIYQRPKLGKVRTFIDVEWPNNSYNPFSLRIPDSYDAKIARICYFWTLLPVIIDREAREIMYLVASVRPSVRLRPLSRLNNVFCYISM